jgi:hypothetical protein
MWGHVLRLIGTNVSEKLAAYIFKMEEEAEE